MRVVWTPEAVQDRHEIWDYIASDNPLAASQMDELFSHAATRIAKHPNLGKRGTIAGTRELIMHESYRLAYEVQQETIWVLTLVCTARQWPPVRG